VTYWTPKYVNYHSDSVDVFLLFESDNAQFQEKEKNPKNIGAESHCRLCIQLTGASGVDSK